MLLHSSPLNHRAQPAQHTSSALHLGLHVSAKGAGRQRTPHDHSSPSWRCSATETPAEPTTLHSSIASPPQIKVPKPRSGPVLGPELGQLFKSFKRLQNGSDIRGIAMEGVPNEPVTLTVGAVFFIGYAFARWLVQKHGAASSADGHSGYVQQPGSKPMPRVSVGRDPRMSGPLVESVLAAGLAAGGAHVDLFGLATTPCMFYSIIYEGAYAGAIMVTASHMPWNAQGLKFFTRAGGLEKTDITDLLTRAAQACGEAGVMLGEPWMEAAHVTASALHVGQGQASTMLPPTSSAASMNGTQASAAPLQAANVGLVGKSDFRPTYAAFLRQLIISGVAAKDAPHLPLLGTKIVVDAGNGAGGFFATEVLAPLGADINGSQFLDPDGSFPNHIPNPEHPSAMAAGSKAVLAAGADLGIVFDTDVDRSAIVDSSGKEINSNRYIALMSAITLREHPGSTIVTDSVTSTGLAEFITALGGKHVRYKRGYKNVIGKGIELNKQGVACHLMMETSGHGAIKENHFLDDGAYMAVKVVIEMVRRRNAGAGGISDLLASLREPAEAAEYRLRITTPEFGAVGAQVLERFHDWVQGGGPDGTNQWRLDEINHEGWRVNIPELGGKQGWALLRQSLHDPLLVLNIESEVAGGAAATAGHILEFLLQHCAGMPLDLGSLKNAKAAAGKK